MAVEAVTPADPLDTAWRIHAALMDWTGKVDGKAAFALSIESAAIGAVIALSAPSRPLAQIKGGWSLSVYWVGVAGLAIGVAMAVLAVVPRIRGRPTSKDWRANFIYFGHLRHWPPDDLVRALRDDDVLPVLARQHIAMSRIAWQKHRMVQVSMWSATLGSALVGCAAVGYLYGA